MFTYSNQHIEEYDAARGTTAALDINIGDHLMECIQQTDVDLCTVRIISDAGGLDKKLKVVMRNLYRLEYIQGSCGLLTYSERSNIVRHHLELAYSITEIKQIKDAASGEKKDEYATKMIELTPKAENLLTQVGYTLGADLGEITSSQDFTKVCISSIVWVVYNNTISYAKAKKNHIYKLAEKVSISGGANNLRAYLVSAPDNVGDSNGNKISNSNGDKISNRNVNTDMIAEIQAGDGGGKWCRYYYRRG